MGRTLKTFTVGWTPQGDPRRILGWNVVLNGSATDPYASPVYGQVFVPAPQGSDYSWVGSPRNVELKHVAVDGGASVYAWVQQVHRGGDSAWISSTGASAADDGLATADEIAESSSRKWAAESGATNDSAWRHPSDTTTIDGGKIHTGTITADKLHIGSAKTSSLHVRGTGYNNNANRLVVLDGVTIVNNNDSGITLTVIDRATHAHVSSTNYALYLGDSEQTALANALNALDSTKIAVLSSARSILFNVALEEAIERCGGGGVKLSHLTSSERLPYVLVGIPGIGKGRGIEIFTGTGTADPYAEYRGLIIDGTPTGIGAGFTDLTVVDGGQIVTGSVTADKLASAISYSGRFEVQGGDGVTKAGMAGGDTGDTAVRLWAGADYANRGSAPFRVTQGGKVYASNVEIAGTKSASWRVEHSGPTWGGGTTAWNTLLEESEPFALKAGQAVLAIVVGETTLSSPGTSDSQIGFRVVLNDTVGVNNVTVSGDVGHNDTANEYYNVTSIGLASVPIDGTYTFQLYSTGMRSSGYVRNVRATILVFQ